MAELNFNAAEVPPAESRSLLPAGDYMVLIEDSELVETKNHTGVMLKIKMNVLEGPFENRKLFANLNVQNVSEQAQQIGQRQLSQLCHAVGKLQVADSSELHLKPFIARVTIRKDKTGQYEDQNEVREYKPLTGSAPAISTPPVSTPAPQTPRIPPQVAPPANVNAPVWAQKKA